MPNIASVVIDAMAKTLLYGPLWALALYLYAGCWLLILASCPGGRAFLGTVFSSKELRELLPQPPVKKSLTIKPSNIIPFRKRRERMAPIEQGMEAAE